MKKAIFIYSGPAGSGKTKILELVAQTVTPDEVIRVDINQLIIPNLGITDKTRLVLIDEVTAVQYWIGVIRSAEISVLSGPVVFYIATQENVPESPEDYYLVTLQGQNRELRTRQEIVDRRQDQRILFRELDTAFKRYLGEKDLDPDQLQKIARARKLAQHEIELLTWVLNNG